MPDGCCFPFRYVFPSRPADIRNTAAGWPAAAALPGKAGIINKIRPSAKVHSAQGQRFVHGQHAAAVTHNAGFVAKGLTDGRAKRDAAVFNCVVTVHVQVAITV